MQPLRSLILLSCLISGAAAAIPHAETERVRTLLRERKFADAEVAARALTTSYPNESDAFLSLGTVMMGRENPIMAVEAFERAVALSPKSSEAHRRLGDACGFAAQKAGLMSKLGFAKRCRTAYEKAVELDPQNLTARVSLLNFYVAAPSMVGGGFEKAYAQAVEIKKIDPVRGHLVLGQILADEKRFAEAFAELETALGLQPEDYNLNFHLGRLAALSGERIDRGIEALEKALALKPATGSVPLEAVHWRLGMLWEKKGNLAAARAAYEVSLKLNPAFQQASDSLKKLPAS